MNRKLLFVAHGGLQETHEPISDVSWLRARFGLPNRGCVPGHELLTGQTGKSCICEYPYGHLTTCQLRHEGSMLFPGRRKGAGSIWINS
ncbi:hypothetical protein P280DRAFT_145059 [Massarina eburnea CBS 473.64]|uniref:Uncharacterized protein n=1 Tax=Massarina eburnea CBS 473.64 TaxID=1395130 RepID=A0A6A6RSE7_9PLEO|nr:hypothetical protein P280DRAFT_145059 [Massarina eburnea CBS 473.64]